MVKVAQTWPAEAFDAIGIKAHQGKFIIQGTEGSEVKLDGDLAARYSRNLELGPTGRWLKIYTSWQYGESQFTLQLPKSKIWTIDLFPDAHSSKQRTYNHVYIYGLARVKSKLRTAAVSFP